MLAIYESKKNPLTREFYSGWSLRRLRSIQEIAAFMPSESCTREWQMTDERVFARAFELKSRDGIFKYR